MSAVATPLISVLVRSMDRPTLDRALASIAAQDYANVEVVVVAACGAQHRGLDAHCGRFPLRLLKPAAALARAQAANAALDAARGAWLNLLDDDDEFLPQHLSLLHAALARHPQAQLAYARSLALDAAGTRSEFGAKFRPWRQLDTGFFHSQAALFSRALIDAGARFDARFAILEDMDFFVQCAQHTPFVFIEQATSVSYRDAGDSGTGTQRDLARIAAATAQLRAKWAVLERRLHTHPEFRLEKAMWLLQQGDLLSAAAEARAVCAQRPDWPDALALAALVAAASGDATGARAALDALGTAQPEEPTLRRNLESLRAWLNSTEV